MVIVVGSGAGGATVAKELAARGLTVILIEKGPVVEERDAFKHYANVDAEVHIMRTICLGGTTVVSAGNGVRCLDAELRAVGIDLSEEFEETEKELGVGVLPDSLFGDGTRKIMEAATDLGLEVQKMPKFIDPAKCKADGRCSFGCPEAAKWSALNFVKQAKRLGATILTNMPVDEVIVKSGEVAGVRCGDRIFTDDTVVLSAGALETPRLLERAGLPTSASSLFVDTFTTIGGVLEGIGFNKEVTMNALIRFDDFILSPHFSRRLVESMEQRGIAASPEDMLGIMVKIKDDEVGVINEQVEKGVTNRDAVLLSEGAAVAGSILEEAGVDPATFVATPLRGAHPGGTAKIGVAVDTRLETGVSGLYVMDASVLPAAPGAPPLLTIVALAKYGSKLIG
ncbi:MAG: GMC family oxidoreductase [Methanophagales archaeon ANME-1-THS]|nr:MAG: GMC family oxidoreductase [Methanophagales archaeon ANME-1-THS]